MLILALRNSSYVRQQPSRRSDIWSFTCWTVGMSDATSLVSLITRRNSWQDEEEVVKTKMIPRIYLFDMHVSFWLLWLRSIAAISLTINTMKTRRPRVSWDADAWGATNCRCARCSRSFSHLRLSPWSKGVHSFCIYTMTSRYHRPSANLGEICNYSKYQRVPTYLSYSISILPPSWYYLKRQLPMKTQAT